MIKKILVGIIFLIIGFLVIVMPKPSESLVIQPKDTIIVKFTNGQKVDTMYSYIPIRIYCPRCAKNGKQIEGKHFGMDVNDIEVFECPICHFLFRESVVGSN